MQFDLRVPIGALFTLYGVLLALYGAFSDHTQYARSLGININLAWGLVLLLFGVGLLWACFRGRARDRGAGSEQGNGGNGVQRR